MKPFKSIRITNIFILRLALLLLTSMDMSCGRFLVIFIRICLHVSSGEPQRLPSDIKNEEQLYLYPGEEISAPNISQYGGIYVSDEVYLIGSDGNLSAQTQNNNEKGLIMKTENTNKTLNTEKGKENDHETGGILHSAVKGNVV